MKKSLFTLSIASILSISLLQTIAYADLDKGLVAYQNKDYTTALKEFTESANEGDVGAQFNLGLMFSTGDGVPKDSKKGIKWYQLAADQGYADAQFNIGLMYENGDGVLKDVHEAIKWYRLAADQSYEPAQYSLGLIYDNGESLPKDAKEAAKWFRIAEDQRNAQIQFNLSMLYTMGEGGSQNNIMAYVLSNLAIEQFNDEKVKKLRDLIERELTPQQLEEAQTIIKEWQVGTPFPTETKN